LTLVLLVPSGVYAQTSSTGDRTATIRGTVLDRADGTPMADVSVRLQETKQEVKTDAAGRFELVNVEPGRRIVSVSIVGFIFVKRAVQVGPGETLDVTIPLSEGTGTYSETVTVTGTGGRFQEQEKSVPAQQTLGSADIQNLRNLLTNDPMRAIQVLPGVTTGDDFRSEFAVRGSGFSRMNFTFDGIPTTFLLHTIQQVQDGGSIAMVNGDILDGITLLNGSYPQRYGNRIGAELDFHMREGSRDRTQVRVGVSGTDASVVSEGPLGRGKRGSWLFSARKSYLEMLLKQIDSSNDFGFGFSDVQSKLVYDASTANHFELGLVAGRSRLDRPSAPDEVFQVRDGRNSAELVNAAWRFTASPAFVVTNRVAFGANQFRNTNVSGFEFASGDGRDLTWRSDFVARAVATLMIEGGGQVQRQHRTLVAHDLIGLPSVGRPSQSYDETAVLSSAYVQAPWSAAARVTLTPGVRVDRWSLTRDTAASPWLLGEVRLTDRFKLRGGAGIHRQFPGFDEAAGLRAGSNLRPERAYHADIGLEQTLGASARWQVTFYNREEHDLLRLPGAELQIVGSRLVGLTQTLPWVNALDGYARGVEWLVQRRSPHGVSGWMSYSYGLTRYRDRTTAESFDGDFDQRHTFNAYGLYRVTDRFNVAAKLRVGSNAPAVGYWEQRDDAYFVSPFRNTLRVPTYSRLDVRGSRTFNWQSRRLTLFVEILNALGHDNLRYNQPGVDVRTGQAFGLFESMIPFVPSAGILIEF
jgi:TonB-dependent receptor-like protein/carboxypeptidase family protein